MTAPHRERPRTARRPRLPCSPTDDYGVARSSHTLEWLKAVQEHNLDYLTMKRMVRNSIEYAFVDAQTKAQIRQSLESAFHQFEQQQTVAAPRR